MRVDYFVSFKINGTWTPDVNFKRDLFADAPLDESLDTGIIVDVPSNLRIIPPFTLCKITMQNAETQEYIGDPVYYFTGDRETEAVTLFQSGEG